MDDTKDPVAKVNEQFKRMEMVARNTILRGTIGSTIHGLNVGGPREDRDEMGVCIETLPYLVHNNFGQYTYRTAVEREGKENAKSRAGDLDLVVYGLRKYIRLALNGNPTILNLLFVPAQDCSVYTREGEQLQALAKHIVSRRAGHAFLGYLHSQKERFLGNRGGSHGAIRPDYVSKFGYDVKYAMHMLRLGIQGVELMTHGELFLPMQQPHRDWLVEVRQGMVPLCIVNEAAESLEKQLRRCIDHSPLPAHPNEALVNDWMMGLYEQIVFLQGVSS